MDQFHQLNVHQKLSNLADLWQRSTSRQLEHRTVPGLPTTLKS